MTPRVDRNGDPLPPYALARFGTLRWRHQGPHIAAIVLARDGQTVFTIGQSVTAIDLATGAPKWVFRSRAQHAGALVALPDGDRLAVGSDADTVVLLDTETGEVRGTLPPRVATLAASRDGIVLVTGFPRFANLYGHDGAILGGLSVDGDRFPFRTTFSPDGRTVATVGATAMLFSVDERRALGTFGDAQLVPTDAAFTPDGRLAVVVSSGGLIACFDTTSFALVRSWSNNAVGLMRVLVSRDGTRVITLSTHAELAVWSLDSGQCLVRRRLSFAYSLTAMTLGADDETVLLGDGARVAFHDLRTLDDRLVDDHHGGAIHALAVSSDGTTLLSVAGLREARWWSLRDGVASPRFGVASSFHSTALAPGVEPDSFNLGSALVATPYAFDLRAKTYLADPPKLEAQPRWRGRAVRVMYDRNVLTITMGNAEEAKVPKLTGVEAVGVAPDDSVVVFANRGVLSVWSTATRAVVATRKERGVRQVVVGPRGDEAALVLDGRVERVRLPGLETIKTYTDDRAPITTHAAYTADGQHLAIGRHEGIRVVACGGDGAEVAWTAHSAAMTAMVFAPDGTLFSGAWDGNVYQWDVQAALADARVPVAPVAVGKKGRKGR